MTRLQDYFVRRNHNTTSSTSSQAAAITALTNAASGAAATAWSDGKKSNLISSALFNGTFAMPIAVGPYIVEARIQTPFEYHLERPCAPAMALAWPSLCALCTPLGALHVTEMRFPPVAARTGPRGRCRARVEHSSDRGGAQGLFERARRIEHRGHLPLSLWVRKPAPPLGVRQIATAQTLTIGLIA